MLHLEPFRRRSTILLAGLGLIVLSLPVASAEGAGEGNGRVDTSDEAPEAVVAEGDLTPADREEILVGMYERFASSVSEPGVAYELGSFIHLQGDELLSFPADFLEFPSGAPRLEITTAIKGESGSGEFQVELQYLDGTEKRESPTPAFVSDRAAFLPLDPEARPRATLVSFAVTVEVANQAQFSYLAAALWSGDDFVRLLDYRGGIGTYGTLMYTMGLPRPAKTEELTPLASAKADDRHDACVPWDYMRTTQDVWQRQYLVLSDTRWDDSTSAHDTLIQPQVHCECTEDCVGKATINMPASSPGMRWHGSVPTTWDDVMAAEPLNAYLYEWDQVAQCHNPGLPEWAQSQEKETGSDRKEAERWVAVAQAYTKCGSWEPPLCRTSCDLYGVVQGMSLKVSVAGIVDLSIPSQPPQTHPRADRWLATCAPCLRSWPLTLRVAGLPDQEVIDVQAGGDQPGGPGSPFVYRWQESKTITGTSEDEGYVEVTLGPVGSGTQVTFQVDDDGATVDCSTPQPFTMQDRGTDPDPESDPNQVVVTCGASAGNSLSVEFDNLTSPVLSASVEAKTERDGNEVAETITVNGGSPAAFGLLFTEGESISLTVVEQPPANDFGQITCSLPSEVTMGNEDLEVTGSCENVFGGGLTGANMCDKFPGLCIVPDTNPIDLQCFAEFEASQYWCNTSGGISYGCVAWDPFTGACLVQGEIVNVINTFCDFWSVNLNCSGEVGASSKELQKADLGTFTRQGPLLSLEHPNSGVVRESERVPVEGHLVDAENGVSALVFLLDGEEVKLEHLRTGLEDTTLCGDWSHPSSSCDSNAIFRGYIPVETVGAGLHTLTVIAKNGGGEPGLTAIDRDFYLDVPAECADDSAPPTVNISSPATEVTEGQHSFTAEAADESGLMSLTLLLDGMEVAQASASPLSYAWNATARPTPYTLRAEAVDGCGNDAFEEIDVAVTAPPPPSFALWSGSNLISENELVGYGPVEEGVVKTNTLTIVNDGSSELVFPVPAFSLSSPHWAFYGSLPTSVPAGGTVDLSIGTAGTAPVGASQATVIIQLPSSFVDTEFSFDVVADITELDSCASDTTAPSVTLEQPASATVGQPVSLVAINTSIDVAKVRFEDDGTLIGQEDSTSPYSVVWTPQYDGSHVLTAEATDNCGLSSSHTITVSVVPEDSCSTDTAAPTLTLTRPASAGDTATVGDVYRLEAFVGADENAVTSVDFLVRGPGASTYQTVGSVSSPTAGTAASYGNWTPTTAGTYDIKAKVTDACSNSREATAVSLSAEADPCSGDTVGPSSVSLTLPLAYADYGIGESVSMEASASTDTESVEFYAGSTLLATDAGAPWSGTHSFSATGSYSLLARAYDGCGNSTDSATVPITVDVSCEVAQISSIQPAQGASVEATGSVGLSATAYASAGVENVVFLVDETEVGRRVYLDTPQTANASVTWDASSAALTSHTLTVESRAVGCDVGRASVTFTLVEPDPCLGDTAGPTVTITHPSAFEVYEPGNITIQSSATDPNGVDRVVTSANSVQLCDDGADDQASYSCAWSASIGDDQPVTVVAYDHCGNAGSSQVPVDIQFTPDSPGE